jgi:hypothetical protein
LQIGSLLFEIVMSGPSTKYGLIFLTDLECGLLEKLSYSKITLFLTSKLEKPIMTTCTPATPFASLPHLKV